MAKRRTGMTTRCVGILLAAAVLLVGLLSVPAFAQTEGAIAGVVRDVTGAVLPGVVVEATSPALIERVRSNVTDGQGQYKIVALRPGTYSVTFTLPGFSTIVREGIELTTGFTANVNADMPVGGLEETITVTGASPVVDVQNVRTQTVLNRDLLEAMPGARDFTAFAALIPGATGFTRGVGGSKGEGTAALGIHAVEGQIYQDGFDIGSVTSAGNRHSTYTSDVLAEEIVMYAVGSAEAKLGGLNVDVITKSGGNVFSGVTSVAYARDGMQSGTLSDELRNRGITRRTTIDLLYDVGSGVGGPIIEDRLWFFGGGRRWGSEELRPGIFWNKLGDSIFYEPDLDREVRASKLQYDLSGKLTLQAGRHKFSGTYNQKYKCGSCDSDRAGRAGNNRSALITPDASVQGAQFFSGTYLRQVTWAYPASNRLLLEGSWGAARATPNYFARDEVPFTARSVADVGLKVQYGPPWYTGRTTSWTAEVTGPGRRPYSERIQTKFAMTYVTGSHAVKVGYTKGGGGPSTTRPWAIRYSLPSIIRSRSG